MVRKLRKIIKQANAKKPIISGILVFLLASSIMLSSILFFAPQHVKADYTDYGYHIKITIDKTKVNTSLKNFPVWVYKTSTDFADHILADGSDIAFYDSTNTTRYNHEIETWNKITGELGVWVNVTYVSSSSNTIFYMYYGYPTTTDDPNYNPKSVWDKNYALVYHMNDNTTSTVNDSTNNLRYGTKGAANQPIQQTGITGNAQNFSNNTWYIDTNGKNIPIGAKTIEIWFNSTNTTLIQALIDDNGYASGLYGQTIAIMTNGSVRYTLCKGGSPVNMRIYSQKAAWNDWNYLAFTWDGSTTANNAIMYLNGTNHKHADSIAATETVKPTYDEQIGYTTWTTYKQKGKIDEIRFSNVQRNFSWINTTYNTIHSPSTFLTFGSEQEVDLPSSYSITGLVSNRIDWTGTAGETVWSNGTGTCKDTLKIILSVNSTDNVTDIPVWVGDMNDSSVWINASNISLYVSSDNSTFGLLGTYDDGGNNLTINSTNWNAGTMGASPFTSGGITDKLTNIYCRFKLEIPISIPSDYYYNGVTWKIYIVQE